MKIDNNKSIIQEDIEAVKKYYPNIDDDMFSVLIELDPTYRKGSSSLGKYGKWILNLYNKGVLTPADANELPNILQQFTTYKNRLQSKDLNAYKSVQELESAILSVIDDDSMLTDRQKLRFLKGVKSGKIQVDLDSDYDVVLDTPNYIVYIPHTHAASMKLGGGTKWCTAHENPDWFNEYTEDGKYKLYIVKNKSTGERWQFSDKNGDFLDENDKEFDVNELMKTDKSLYDFFRKIINLDETITDGTLIYKGTMISSGEKSKVEHIIVQDGLTDILEYAFDSCKNLLDIKIPSSISSIGDSAFAECESLESISIPNSVVHIGDSAFERCSSIKEIRLPDSISVISDFTFSFCTGLTSVVIPESVLYIGQYSFESCSRLENIEIPIMVDRIEDCTFSNCTKLKTITFLGNVKYIGKHAFFNCHALKEITLPNSVKEIGEKAFAGCWDIVIHTDSEYVKEYCRNNGIECVSKSNGKSERINRRRFKLRISEDTACIPAKTSYINEDGLDQNGIYYFGDKPDAPLNWRDYDSISKKLKCMTAEDFKKRGFEDGKKFASSLTSKSVRMREIARTAKYRVFRESVSNEYGRYMNLDGAIDDAVNNMPESSIDDTIRYLDKIASKFGRSTQYSDIVLYSCYESYLDPTDYIDVFGLSPLYRNGKYDSFIGDYNGKTFIVDHFGDADFNIYALDERTIDGIINYIERMYE